MAELDDRELLDEAYRQFRTAELLRQKERWNDTVRFNLHPLHVPAAVAERIGEGVYSGEADQVLNRFVAMEAAEPPIFHVAAPGATKKSREQAETVQNWCTGMLGAAAVGERNLYEAVTEDVGNRSRGWVYVAPRIDQWHAALADCQCDGSDPEVERWKREHAGIEVRWADAHLVVDQWAGGTPSVVYEYRTEPVRDVLETYVDARGEPLAKLLAADYDQKQMGAEPTRDEMVTLCVRADRTHIQVAILGSLVDSGIGGGFSWFMRGTEEVILSQEHGLDEVPYAPFVGRLTRDPEPARRYWGLLDPIVPLVCALDEALTQQLAISRFGAYPGGFVERHEKMDPASLGQGDRKRSFGFNEGEIFDGLLPGETIKALNLTDATEAGYLEKTVAMLRELIERHTFGHASYTNAGASSGYEYGLALGGAEILTSPFHRGLVDGWPGVARLMLKSARALMEDGYGPVPVGYQTAEGERYVTLTEEHVGGADDPFIAWTITAEVRPRLVGGEQAEMQYALTLLDKRVVDMPWVRERLRIDNPEKMADRVFLEDLKNDPSFRQLLVQQLQQELMAEAQNRMPSLPQGGTLPAALAGRIGQSGAPELEGLKARLGLPEGPQPGMGGGGPGPEGVGPVGGAMPGQGQALPGGAARQMDVLGARGGT